MKKNKPWFVTVFLLIVLITFTSIYALYAISLLSGIEDMLRFFFSLLLTFIWSLFLLFACRVLIRNKFSRLLTYSLIAIVYIGGVGYAANTVDKTLGRLSNISSNSVSYSSSIVTLTDNDISSLEDIDNEKIGMLSDKKSIDGYQIPNEIIKKNKLKNEIQHYDSYVALIYALAEGDVKYVFLPTNYNVLFGNISGLEELEETTKIIHTYKKNVKVSQSGNSKITSEPFTLLLMGVDSEKEGIANSSFNGDSLMLITFNPKTLNTTILSIPRDTYVPIACFDGKRANKITHAAWYGQNCMIETIEDFTGIDINYYLKMNFKGVVKLIDNLGGVEVDVPYSFCEQNSNRKWGANTVYVEEGLQTLTGEQALALARNRHPNPTKCAPKWTNYSSNDFIRGQNQQTVVKAILNKAKDIRSLDVVTDLLDTLSSNLETNMSTNEVLSFYDILKKIVSVSGDIEMDDLLSMQKLSLSGYDRMIYDYSLINRQGMKMTLYNFVPYKGSIKDVSDAMKINLGILKEEPIKTFAFSVRDPYKEKVIGKNEYNEAIIPLVPSFVGRNYRELSGWAEKSGIKVNVNYVTSDIQTDYVGMVKSQNAPVGMDIRYIGSGGMVVNVVNKVNEIKPVEPLDCSLVENKDDSTCRVPNFTGDPKEAVAAWFSKRKVTLDITYEEITISSPEYDATKSNKVVRQSITSGSIYDLIGKPFTITYMAETISQ